MLFPFDVPSKLLASMDWAKTTARRHEEHTYVYIYIYVNHSAFSCFVYRLHTGISMALG